MAAAPVYGAGVDGAVEDVFMTFTQHNATVDDDIPDEATSIHLGSDPGLMITAVPALLGFLPRNSIILVGLTRANSSHLVGPVVRCDMDRRALSEGCAALGRAMYDRPEPGVVAIVVSPGTWPMPGAVEDLLDTASMELAEYTVGLVEVLVTDTIQAGRRWWRVEHDDGGGRWFSVNSGLLGEARENPVQDTMRDSDFTGSMTQGEFREVLTPVEATESLARALPESWSSGMACPRAVTVDDVEQMRRLVQRIDTANGPDSGPDTATGLAEHPGRGPWTGQGIRRERARDQVRRVLAEPGTADLVFDIFLSNQLYPCLVVLGLREDSVAVDALLHEVAGLSRSTLRRRALALTGVLGMCGRNGTLGLQAVRLCLSECADEKCTPDPGEYNGDLAAMAFLNMVVADSATRQIASEIVTGVCDGGAAQLAVRVLDEGCRLIRQATDIEQEVNRVFDPGQVSAVRTALARRAER